MPVPFADLQLQYQNIKGEIDEARAALRILKDLQPELSLKWIEESLPYRRERDRQKFIEGFRLAGLE